MRLCPPAVPMMPNMMDGKGGGKGGGYHHQHVSVEEKMRMPECIAATRLEIETCLQ